jgi:hypothetical protein
MMPRSVSVKEPESETDTDTDTDPEMRNLQTGLTPAETVLLCQETDLLMDSQQ